MERLKSGIAFLASILVSLVGVHAAQCQQADKREQSQQTFYATVQERFSKWDANNDGVLSEDEIVKAFQNPKCKGSRAAAIAVLQRIETGHLIKKEPFETLTLEKFDKLTIWNPWGTSGNYKELGVKMQNGQFDLPTADFIEKCNNVMFELAEDAAVNGDNSGKKRGGGHEPRNRAL